MTRAKAISYAETDFDSGKFRTVLARRVAIPSESQNPSHAAELGRYLEEEMVPAFSSMGFATKILHHSRTPGSFLFAQRIEDPGALTVLGYGHGDVIQGFEGQWRNGCSPWLLTEADGCWYGRGVADNKGQHSVNIAALQAVLSCRGQLGFNAKYLIEMGEELGSPGLRELCEENRELFAADILIASDGPRLSLARPTIFLGARGAYPIDFEIDARKGAHHSGNWGGLLSNPAIQLAHALSSLVGPAGQIRVPALVPSEIPPSVKAALADCEVEGGPEGPQIETWWGEPGLSPAEKVFGWSSFEVLALEAGSPLSPVNAIPPKARARCQLRFVAGVEEAEVLPAIRRHLERHGLSSVLVDKGPGEIFHATRLDPNNPWVRWAASSIERTTGNRAAILPNLGGALPNDVFSGVLGLPTIWIPHSYPGCSQHAPDENLPATLFRESLAIMAGLYWDLGDAAKGGSKPDLEYRA